MIRSPPDHLWVYIIKRRRYGACFLCEDNGNENQWLWVLKVWMKMLTPMGMRF